MSSPVPTAAPVVRDAFLDAVRAADLLTSVQFARAEATIPHDVSTTVEAARALMAVGYLTKFQAERILAGRTDGFHLGPYVILDQIGRGSMGRVYKAKHRTMNRAVAIKLLSSGVTRTAADRQALQKEVRSVAQLNHPNIVTAYDANELADRHYLVLEYVDGPNLETMVRERGPLPVIEACELAMQIAMGLSHAHSHGVIHRDLKPSNLLVARSSLHPGFVVKICDFGVARLTPSQSPAHGKFHRCPDFVAPELARDLDTADHRVDLYSLGAVLYFLLSGSPPFSGGTPEEKICRHLLEEPVRIERLRSDVQPALAALIHQLLAKHPQSRPGLADEVVERLEGNYGATSNVSFDLPSANGCQYSFASGQLSGGQPVPMAESVAERSGPHTLPDSGVHTVNTPVAEHSPWEQITESHLAPDTPIQIRSPLVMKRSRFSVWGLGGLFAGMLLASAAVVIVMAKIAAK